MDYSDIINRLEAQIRQFRVEYQRFFNGDSKVPPEDQGAAIRKQLNQLASVSQLPSVDRFRLTGLEGRFNSLSELYRRRLRDLDISPPVAVPRAESAAAGAAAADAVSMIVGESVAAEEIGNLYDAIYSKGSTKVALEDFHAYLLDQAAEVRKRTGCSKVRFTVRSADGKKRLKARPMPTDA